MTRELTCEGRLLYLAAFMLMPRAIHSFPSERLQFIATLDAPVRVLAAVK